MEIPNENRAPSRGVHAFVDKKTDHTSSIIQSTCKACTFQPLHRSDREWLLENADWAGGYLYMK